MPERASMLDFSSRARVHVGRAGAGYAKSRIDLRTAAEVPGIAEVLFLGKVEAAKRDCAVSEAIARVEQINLKSRLVEHTGKTPHWWRLCAESGNQAGVGDGFREDMI